MDFPPQPVPDVRRADGRLVRRTGVFPARRRRLTGVVRDATGASVPGATVTVSNQATGASQTRDLGRGRQRSPSAVPPGTYTVTVALKGFGRQTRKDVKVDAGATLPSEFALEAQREEEVTVTAMLREQSVEDVPFSIAAPTEDEMRERGIDSLESLAANVAGFTVQNLGPGQSQVAMRGVSAGQIVRDQPGRQGAGGRLSRRFDHLPLAVHAGHRPVRRRPRRGAARPAGHAVRRRLPLRHRALHQQPARDRRDQVVRRGGRQHDQRRQPRRQRQAGLQRAAGRARPPCAWPPTTTGWAATSTPCSPTSASRRTSTPATARACARRSRSLPTTA